MSKDARFKPHKSLPDQIRGHLAGAIRKLETAYKLLEMDCESSYELAYEAILKASLALVFKHNLRPRSLPGHHQAIIEMADQILGDRTETQFRIFDEMRRNRNAFLYDAYGFVSEHEAREALAFASDYIETVKKKLGNI